jgi:hypothetical protein
MRAEQHFDNDEIEGGLRLIEEILNKIADPNQTKNVRQAQMRFGWILHAIQDFYSHSDYVEAWLEAQNPGVQEFEKMVGAPRDIPTWKRGRIVGTRSLTTGTWPGRREGQLHHDDLNKDDPHSKGGRVKISGGVTLFEIARTAAEKDTEEMIEDFDRAVRRNPLFKDKSPFTVTEPEALVPSYP